MKENLILIGGGGHCKSCIDVIEMQDKYEIAGIIDIEEKIGQTVLNYPIIACDYDLEKISREYKTFLITLGQIETPEKRIYLYQKLRQLNVKLATVVSPIAYISKYASIGEGTIVLHGAIINTKARIGENCIINTKALVEHDAKIGNHCHISTGAIVNGSVTILEGTFYGSGAVSKQGITIKENSFIKANSIVKE